MSDLRQWVVYRTAQRTRVYTGIEARSRDEALDAFLRGEGEIQPDRERWTDDYFDAVDIREPRGTQNVTSVPSDSDEPKITGSKSEADQ